MLELTRALRRLEKAMPTGMAFFGFLLILFGIIGVLTTSSEISQRKKSADTRSQASEPATPPNPPPGCWYKPIACTEPGCTPTYELECPTAPIPVAPARSDGKIIWETQDVHMRADALVITLLDGRVFTTRDIVVRLASDPISINRPNYLTLEGTWYEQGVEMRLYLYLLSNPQANTWYVNEIRVYNGNTPGDWITFRQPNDPTGASYRINTALGNVFTFLGTLTLESTDPAEAATIRFTNLSLATFLRNPPYCEQVGERPADISGDEHVDMLDIDSLSDNFFKTGELDADLNCDGFVDLQDYTVLINQL